MQDILTKGITWRVGSDLYGLNTLTSDKDYVTIWFDREDLPFRKFSEFDKIETQDSIKAYSLPQFCKILVIGNPNMSELCYSPWESGFNTDVHGFIQRVVDFDIGVHQGTAKASMGHVIGLVSEIRKKGLTPKRLSHGFRMLFTLKHVLRTGEIYLMRDHPAERDFALRVKTDPDVMVLLYSQFEKEVADMTSPTKSTCFSPSCTHPHKNKESRVYLG